MPQDVYQAVQELAQRLEVSEATVRRWIKTRELRAIDTGKGWRIASAYLEVASVDVFARTKPRTQAADDRHPLQANVPMQRGSEAAKEAADLVLTDDNFTSIAAAVREGLRGPSRYARTSRVREWQTTRYRSR